MKFIIQHFTGEKCERIMQMLQQFNFACKPGANGNLEITNVLSAEQEYVLKNEIIKFGFKIRKDKKGQLVDDIKTNINNLILSPKPRVFNLAFYLSKELGYNYTYLTNIFSEETGISIRQYIITQKIERIKTLMIDKKLNLKEIASLMKYSNVSHLTNQFKKITGVTPSTYKKRTQK